MGLACSQIRLLTLTSRKNDCEYNINIASMEKIALAKEQTKLSLLYNSKLRATKLCYYQNGDFHKLNYSYLMPEPNIARAREIINGTTPCKDRNDMVLTDYTGRVVLDSKYSSAITAVLGSSVLNGKGQGCAFSADKIPKIIRNMLGYQDYSLEEINKVIHDDECSENYNNKLGGVTDISL